MEKIGQGIMLMISLQMMDRRDLVNSVTELEDKVRPIKPSNVCQKVLRWVRGKSRSRFLTSFELNKPGMDSKNFSSESSSPRALMVQPKIRTSISDDCFDAVSSAFFSTLPNIQRLKRLCQISCLLSRIIRSQSRSSLIGMKPGLGLEENKE